MVDIAWGITAEAVLWLARTFSPSLHSSLTPLPGDARVFQLTGMSWAVAEPALKIAITGRALCEVIWPSTWPLGFCFVVVVLKRVFLSSLGWLWAYNNPPASTSQEQELPVCTEPTGSFGLGFHVLRELWELLNFASLMRSAALMWPVLCCLLNGSVPYESQTLWRLPELQKGSRRRYSLSLTPE